MQSTVTDSKVEDAAKHPRLEALKELKILRLMI